MLATHAVEAVLWFCTRRPVFLAGAGGNALSKGTGGTAWAAGIPAPSCITNFLSPLHSMPTWPTSPQGLDDPKLVFQALPATLRGRQYADLLTSTHPAAAGAHPRHNSRTSLRRLGSVDTGLEATPRQVGGFAVDGCVGG